MEASLDEAIARDALREALEKYPQFAAFGPKLVARPVYRGVTYQLQYEAQPPPDPDAWEFQNAAVKSYKRRIATP